MKKLIALIVTLLIVVGVSSYAMSAPLSTGPMETVVLGVTTDGSWFAEAEGPTDGELVFVGRARWDVSPGALGLAGGVRKYATDSFYTTLFGELLADFDDGIGFLIGGEIGYQYRIDDKFTIDIRVTIPIGINIPDDPSGMLGYGIGFGFLYRF